MTDMTERLRELVARLRGARLFLDDCTVPQIWIVEMPKSLRDDAADTIDHFTQALAEANARAERMREALSYCANAPHSGWTVAQGVARATLATLPDPDKRAAALSDLAALDGESM